MDFQLKSNYSLSDINKIIKNRIEESFYLDFKSADALGFEDHKKDEISKDVSSFANSDGGVIIYGVREKDHVPIEITPIDGLIFTKEWLEHIITDRIQQRIPDLHIYPIRLENKIEKTIYIVKIPASPLAPHMCNNNRYYKRYDFKSIPMMEFEVRRLYSRPLMTKLTIKGIYLNTNKETQSHDSIEYQDIELGVLIKNIGKLLEKDYKIKVQLKTPDNINLRYSYSPDSVDHLLDDVLYYTFVNKSYLPIFPEEETTCLKFNIQVPINQVFEFKENSIVKIRLLYTSGEDSADYLISDAKPIK